MERERASIEKSVRKDDSSNKKGWTPSPWNKVEKPSKRPILMFCKRCKQSK